MSQLVLKQCADSWVGYFEALQAYEQDSSKFTGKPKPPGYADDKNVVKFNIQAIGKREFKKGWIVPSMSPVRILVKPGLQWEQLCEVRIVPKVGCYVIEVVYETEESILSYKKPDLAASIDVGLDNLAFIVFNDLSIQSFIINGKPLKAENQFFNKQVARYKGLLPVGVYTSRRIQNITRNRNHFITSYLHQATRMIVDSKTRASWHHRHGR